MEKVLKRAYSRKKKIAKRLPHGKKRPQQSQQVKKVAKIKAPHIIIYSGKKHHLSFHGGKGRAHTLATTCGAHVEEGRVKNLELKKIIKILVL